jgi:hypothetical protein
MRRENPSAPVDLILDAAVRTRVVANDRVSVSTLRRLFAAVGTTRSAATHRNWRETRIRARFEPNAGLFAKADLGRDAGRSCPAGASAVLAGGRDRRANATKPRGRLVRT